MRFRRISVLALLTALFVGLVAAPPATSTSAPQDATADSTATAKKKSKKAGTLSGTVTFQGKPAAGTWVTASGGGKDFAERTDKKGRFSIKVPTGSYRVVADNWDLPVWRTWSGNTVRKPDAKKVKVSVGENTKIAIKLKAAAHVTGKIFESDGTPGYEVTFHVSSARNPDLPKMFETDEEGNYQLRYFRSDTLRIWRSDGSRTEALADTITVRVKKGKIVTAPDYHVRAGEMGTITARIEGAEDFSVVHAYSEGPSWSEGLDHDPVTGLWSAELPHDPVTGLWSAEVPPGLWGVRVAGAQTESELVNVEAGATTDAGTLVVPAERGAIHVTTLDKNGKPLKNGNVLVLDKHQWYVKDKRSKGTVKLNDLVPGTYWVALNYFSPWTGFGSSPHPQKIVVEAGVTKKVTLRLEKGRTVKGVVRHRGKPVRGMVVRAFDPTGVSNPNGTATTDAKGRFVLKNVPRGVRHLKVEDPSPMYRDATATIKAKGSVKALKIKVKK